MNNKSRIFVIVCTSLVLLACGGGGESTPTAPNVAPVANAGADQSVLTNAAVTLDGSASSDANGDALAYAWTLTSKPQGSTAILSSATSAKTTFTADLPGTFVASLIVSDGKVNSGADTVNVSAAAAIAASGTVSTLAGTGAIGFVNGAGTSARFNNPTGVALDVSGNVYVADYDNAAIRKITPAGVVSTLAGTGTSGFVNGSGASARFYSPMGVAVDVSGNVYVADTNNHAIRKISPAGVVSTLAGSGSAGFVDGTGTTASFYYPGGVAVDVSGNVYVAENNHVIRKISPAGVVSTLAGSGAIGFVNGNATTARFNSPGGVAVDSFGNVYVADSGNYAIRKITPAGVVTTLAGSGTVGLVNGTGTTARFSNAQSVAVDGSGNVYVADLRNYVIRKITPAGVVSTLAGSGSVGFVDGPGASASFNFPWSVAVQGSGYVFVADASNNAIRKIAP